MTNNFTNREEISISLNGNNTPTFSCDMPSSLRDGLLSKAMSVSSLYLNNTSIPIFIPELATSSTLTYNPGATTTNTVIGANGGINATDYFVVFRNRSSNAVACAAIVQWVQTRNVSPPSSPPDENSVFTTPYYYCYDFADFLISVQNSITAAIVAVQGPIYVTPVLLFDSATNTFNLSVPDTIGVDLVYSLEFSPKLIKLLPFQNIATNYGTFSLQWQQLTVALDSNTYFLTTAPLYDTIFPFDLVLLNCNLPMIPVEFISNQASAIPLQRRVFFKFRKANAGLSIYNFFEASNNYVFDKLHRFTQQSAAAARLNITLILRTRKNKNYIEWSFPSDSELSIDLGVFSF